MRRGIWLTLAALATLVLVVLAARPLFVAAPSRAQEEHAEAEHEEAPAVPARLVAARRGELRETIAVPGILEALPNARARIAAPIVGRLVGVYARLGERVRAGQVVAAVDAADLAADLRRAQATGEEAARQAEAARADVDRQRAASAAQEREAAAALRAAEARLHRARAGSRPEEIARAAANLRALEADLARLRAGPRAQEIAQAEATLREADAQQDAAQRAAERKRRLLDQGIVAAKDVERADADLAQAQAHRETARQALDLLRAGPRPEEIQAQEARVAESRSALELARAGSRPEEITEAEAAVREAHARLAAARAERWQSTSLRRAADAARSRARAAGATAAQAAVLLARAQVRAPFDGVVSERFADSGEVVSPGAPLLEIVRPDRLRVTAQVAPRVAGGLAVGLPARVRLAGTTGGSAPAVVAVVGAAAAPDTGLIPVELRLQGRLPGGRDGMGVEVTLMRRSHTTGVLLPSRSIFTREGENFVYVVDGEHVAHERRIEVGVEQGDQAQVTAGVKPGEQVLADGSASLADGTKIEPLP